jgi:glutathione peroxidase
MTFRQQLMKWIYPLVMLRKKLVGVGGTVLTNATKKQPPTPIYDLCITLNTGSQQPLEAYRGKKLLLVNTASNCGYTGQYAELQQLHEQYKEKLVVIGFPCNDFKQQEPYDNKTIAEFCQINYGVNFLLSQKVQVRKGEHQHPLFTWLSNSTKNGWLNQVPTWNFCKYLVNEQGILTHFFNSDVSPLSSEVKNAIQ